MQPQLKKHKRYWFYRLYCLVVAVAWNGVGIWHFYQLSFHHEKRPPVELMYFAPFVIPAIFMCFSWMAFPFKYSIFGRYERTPFPQERPVLTHRGSWGRIWWFGASIPFFSWYVFESGLGISVLFLGKFFIPVGHIAKMKKGFFAGYKLWHTSPELRNPVTMPGSRVFEAVLGIVRRYEQKTHPAEGGHS